MTQLGCHDWYCIQLTMRAYLYDKPHFGRTTKPDSCVWHEQGWTYTLGKEVVDRKVLLHLRAQKSLQYLQHPTKSAPAKLHENELFGLPLCHCPCATDNRQFLQNMIQCRVSHACDQTMTPNQHATDSARNCHACKHPLVCERCGSDWRTTLHVVYRGDHSLSYDGVLTIDRTIDAGPIELAVSREQFSNTPHPAYEMPESVAEDQASAPSTKTGPLSKPEQPATNNAAALTRRNKGLRSWYGCGKRLLGAKR